MREDQLCVFFLIIELEREATAASTRKKEGDFSVYDLKKNSKKLG